MYLFFIAPKLTSISFLSDLRLLISFAINSSSVAIGNIVSIPALGSGLTEGLYGLIGVGNVGLVPGETPGLTSGLTPGLGELAPALVPGSTEGLSLLIGEGNFGSVGLVPG